MRGGWAGCILSARRASGICHPDSSAAEKSEERRPLSLLYSRHTSREDTLAHRAYYTRIAATTRTFFSRPTTRPATAAAAFAATTAATLTATRTLYASPFGEPCCPEPRIYRDGD